MMNTANPYLKQYKKNQIETATPEQVLILLYDGAIQFLNKAKFAIEESNATAITDNTFACQKIILEFMNTLDMERGGDLAQNLHNLYGYLFEALSEINISKDIKKLDEILSILVGLRETWQKAIAISNSEKEVDLMDNYSHSDNYDDDEYEDDEEDNEEDDS